MERGASASRLFGVLGRVLPGTIGVCGGFTNRNNNGIAMVNVVDRNGKSVASTPVLGHGLRTEHPEGKMRLLDDTLLTVYPDASPSEEGKQTHEEQARIAALFLAHVPLFWKCRELILSDSRLYLAHVPLRSGLAYIGSFPYPTLGMLIEFWEICGAAHFVDRHDGEQFVCLVAGSPLSGCNRCTCVGADGKKSIRSIDRFKEAWQRLADVLARYGSVRRGCASYSIEEVIVLLKRCEPKLRGDRSRVMRVMQDFSRRYERVRLKKRCEQLEGKLEYAEKSLTKAIALYRELTLEKHRTELEALYAEYETQSRAWGRRKEELAQERRAIRLQLRADPRRNRELQPRLRELSKEKRDWESLLSWQMNERLREYFADFPITIGDLGQMLKKK